MGVFKMGLMMTTMTTSVLLLGLCSVYFVTGNPTGYVVTWDADLEAPSSSSEEITAPLLGSKKCTYGPSYWCHNITHARECHAMSHCIKSVWEDLHLPEDNDDVCSVCKEMVKEARDQLLSNETQDELRQVLEGSCALIPLKLVAKECTQLADNFIPELVDALASRMDPQVVCSVSGLCNNARIDRMLEELRNHTAIKTVAGDCRVCNYYMKGTFGYVGRLERRDMRLKMLDSCGYLGSYSDSCRMAVMEEFDKIYAHLTQPSVPSSYEFCQLFGMCGDGPMSTEVATYTPQTQGDDDLPCDFCKTLVTRVKTWLGSNTTQEQFEKVIQGLCRACTVPDDCKKFFRQYGHDIYVLIQDDLEPESFCQRVGVCAGGKNRLTSDSHPVWTILGSNDDDDDRMQLINQGELPMAQLLPGERVTEDDERGAVGMVQLLPGERLTGDDERGAVGMVQLLPGERLTGDDERGAVGMVQLLPGERLTGDDERGAVGMVQLLPGEMLTGDDERGTIEVVGGSGSCSFCEYVLKEAQTYMDDPKTEKEAKEVVDHLCERYLPKEMNDQCEEFVDNYGDSLIVLLSQEIDPKEICPRLNLCPKQKPKDFLPTCKICEMTVSKAIAYLDRNMTKEEIEVAMARVCRMMPSQKYVQECNNFMENYGDQVIEMILIDGSSHEICAALHLCLFSNQPPPLPALSPIPTVEAVSLSDDNTKCVICEYVITTLASKIKDNATEEEIKKEVEGICEYLPKTVSKNCVNFVEMYGDQLISYLSMEMDPDEICTKLDLCKPKQLISRQLTDCEMCEMIADYYMKKTHPKFNCSSLFGGLEDNKRKCTEMIEDYGEYLARISTGLYNSNVCKTIDIC